MRTSFPAPSLAPLPPTNRMARLAGLGAALAAGVLAATSSAACADEILAPLEGSVEVEVRNVRAETKIVSLVLSPEGRAVLTAEPAAEQPATVHRFDKVGVGLASIRCQTLELDRTLLDQLTVFPVAVVANDLTRVVIDFATGDVVVDPPVDGTPGVCVDENGNPDPEREVLCGHCTEPDGAYAADADDDDCGALSCDGLDAFRLTGDNSAAGTSQCWFDDFAPVSSNRCQSVGVCKPENDPETCGTPVSSVALEAGVCETLAGCAGSGPPSVVVAPNGTPCGSNRVCDQGLCVEVVDPVDPPDPPAVGCADGAREGFIDQSTWPDIAACEGAFSVPGVTRAGLAPACGRAGGDDGANAEGNGCSAADLCMEGWHVCNGKTEVAAKAPGGCAAAVPAGTPDKMLFFAVAQHSTNGSVCDDASSGDNDVFGCGNLGTQLSADKNCGVLTRVLASTQPNRCGFNEAEPSNGPWLCQGGTDSHLHEGGIVSKVGCPGTSCSYDGNPISNARKGGVLCCRD